jgi:hypothetical protein
MLGLGNMGKLSWLEPMLGLCNMGKLSWLESMLGLVRLLAMDNHYPVDPGPPMAKTGPPGQTHARLLLA